MTRLHASFGPRWYSACSRRPAGGASKAIRPLGNADVTTAGVARRMAGYDRSHRRGRLRAWAQPHPLVTALPLTPSSATRTKRFSLASTPGSTALHSPFRLSHVLGAATLRACLGAAWEVYHRPALWVCHGLLRACAVFW